MSTSVGLGLRRLSVSSFPQLDFVLRGISRSVQAGRISGFCSKLGPVSSLRLMLCSFGLPAVWVSLVSFVQGSLLAPRGRLSQILCSHLVMSLLIPIYVSLLLCQSKAVCLGLEFEFTWFEYCPVSHCCPIRPLEVLSQAPCSSLRMGVHCCGEGLLVLCGRPWL